VCGHSVAFGFAGFSLTAEVAVGAGFAEICPKRPERSRAGLSEIDSSNLDAV